MPPGTCATVPPATLSSHAPRPAMCCRCLYKLFGIEPEAGSDDEMLDSELTRAGIKPAVSNGSSANLATRRQSNANYGGLAGANTRQPGGNPGSRRSSMAALKFGGPPLNHNGIEMNERPRLAPLARRESLLPVSWVRRLVCLDV